MITLYTSFYQDSNPERQKELIYCLKQNIENPLIDRILIFTECPIPENPKITIIGNCRPTYRMLFDAVNTYCQNEHEISLISNTDIYFDDSLSKLILNARTCVALSRWDVKPGQEPKLHNERFSQDVWIFQGKVRKIRFCDFFLGVPGCDNRIAWELNQAGYVLYNPATTIKSYHYHPSDLHTYDGKTRIPKPYLFIEVR